MSPTLDNGDKLLVLRHWYPKHFKLGQIVISLPPKNVATVQLGRDSSVPYVVKRIWGLPNDIVSIHTTQIHPQIRRMISNVDKNGYYTWHVPDGHYFLRGDAPGGDSILWGPMPKSSLKGIVIRKL